MRHKPLQIRSFIILAFGWIGALTSIQAQQTTGNSIVKIHCISKDAPGVGTGFAWKNENQIVTALHVVAGCGGILVESDRERKKVGATVIHVYKNADLAMLQLEKPLGLTALKNLGQVKPDIQYKIAGYPKGVETWQKDKLDFSEVDQKVSKLKDIIDKDYYDKILGSVGYPSFTTSILRISSTIQPGHSGAPIFDPQGNVVGIGDGGLYEGIRGINWAIPSANNLELLAKSEEDRPTERPKLATLMSARTTPSKPEEISLATGSALQYKFTASVENIVDASSPEAAEDLEAILSENISDQHDESSDDAESEDIDSELDVSNYETFYDIPDLREALLDIYEDSATGATIAIPHGMHPKLNDNNQMITTTDKDHKLSLFIKVSDKNGEKASQEFESHFKKMGDWKIDPNKKDDIDADEEQILMDKHRYIGDNADDPDKSLFYSTSVDLEDQSFLGTAIVAKNLEHLSEKDQKNFLIMEICVELAGFRID